MREGLFKVSCKRGSPQIPYERGEARKGSSVLWARNALRYLTKFKGDIMTKSELVAELAAMSNVTKADAERVLNSFIDIAKKTLKEEGGLALSGFGSFVVTKREARKGRNPQTGEPIDIKASKAVRFRAGKALKDSL